MYLVAMEQFVNARLLRGIVSKVSSMHSIQFHHLKVLSTAHMLAMNRANELLYLQIFYVSIERVLLLCLHLGNSLISFSLFCVREAPALLSRRSVNETFGNFFFG